jgi:hypothetical protein
VSKQHPITGFKDKIDWEKVEKEQEEERERGQRIGSSVRE